MLLKITVVFMLILSSSCSQGYIGSIKNYKSSFDHSRVDDARRIILSFSNDKGLEVFEKDQGRMRFLSSGRDAFFISLYFKGDPILTITNVGVGDVLTFSASGSVEMSADNLNELSNGLRTILEESLDIEFNHE